MSDYRFILQPYKGMNTRYRCTECKKGKTFVRYIDISTGNHLPEQYGRCNRESKCTYHLNPYLDGYAKRIAEQERSEYVRSWKGYNRLQKATPKAIKKTEPVFIPFDVFAQTRQGYEKNTFIQNLLSRVPYPFKAEDVEQVITQYHLGTVCNGYRAGAVTFPFIDTSGNVRSIQVKQFDQTNHTKGTDFLHSIIEKHHSQNNEPLPAWLDAYNKNDLKVSCLFGERILSKYPINPVALVEAPKTAVYSTLYFGFPEQPENFIWLAVYNLSSLTLEKCKVLQGRDVCLFPDLSKDGKAFQAWSNKAKQFSDLIPDTRFEVSDLMETLAARELKEDGADIADVLIKMDWRKFRLPKIEPAQIIKQPAPEPTRTLKSEKGEKSEAPTEPFFSQSENIIKPYIEHQVKPIAPEPKMFSKISVQDIKPFESWESEIAELELYFSQIDLPQNPIRLNGYSTITDFPLFIESHLTIVKENNGKQTFIPFLNRLHQLKQYFTENTKCLSILPFFLTHLFNLPSIFTYQIFGCVIIFQSVLRHYILL